MKTIKLATAGILALTWAGYVSAQEVVNVVGSTAYRTFVTEAEVTVASAGGTAATGAYVDSAFNTGNGSDGGTHSTVHGFLSDGTEVYYRNYWTGSLSGDLDVAVAATSDKFIPTTATLSAIIGVGGGGTVYTGAYDSGALPNLAMSDVNEADAAACLAAKFPSSASSITGAGLTDAGTGADVTNQTVGGVTFQWVLGNISGSGFSAPFTNITSAQASELVQSGIVPLSVFTGNTTDTHNFVVFIGRNEDSGTRVTYDAQSLGGGNPQSDAFGPTTKQYDIQVGGPAIVANSNYVSGYLSSQLYTSVSIGTEVIGFKAWPASWPLNTESSLNWNQTGHSGYNGGGDVAATLGTPNPVLTLTSNAFTSSPYLNTPPGFVKGTSLVYIVSCLGCNDAKTAIADGGTALTYNGVGYSQTNTNNVATGQYPLFNLEHAYYVISGSNAIGSNQEAADKLADQIYATPTSTLAPVGVNFTDFTGFTPSQVDGTAP